ncbi:hypothetical protein NECID01_1270 [Nematocida sp. AWRm77]|nr:hypothetical protein NECID01_1270 [Nematocida sp. AWRm77]
MRNRTQRYIEAFQAARSRDSARKKSLLRTLEEYKKTHASLPPPEKYGAFSLVAQILQNCTEKRLCTYQRSTQCLQCKEEVYVCGLNCKTCGAWVCLQCIRTSTGTPLCDKCACLLSETERQPQPLKSFEKLLSYYTLLRKCTKMPTLADISKLAQEAKALESCKHPAGSCEERVAKSALTRTKIIICNWYLFQAQEEKCALLFEQLNYLKRLKQSTPECSELINEAIQDTLKEIAKQEHIHTG